jgi:hypothetical protein
MRSVRFCFILMICMTICPYGFSDDVSALGKTILDKADSRFYPFEGSIEMILNTEDSENVKREYRMQAYKKGSTSETIVFSLPLINKNNVGMRTGDTIYWKEAKWPKPRMMSYQAVFVDSAFSFGDILTGDMELYYKATKIEKVKENEKELYYIVLGPKKQGLYARIDTWIDVHTYDTLKRIYYTASGEKLKTAIYSNIKEDKGGVISFDLSMEDYIAQTKAIARISAIKSEKLPNFLFDPENIGRIHVK